MSDDTQPIPLHETQPIPTATGEDPSSSAGLMGALRALVRNVWRLFGALAVRAYWWVLAIPHLRLWLVLAALGGAEYVAYRAYRADSLGASDFVGLTGLVVCAATALLTHKIALYRGDV